MRLSLTGQYGRTWLSSWSRAGQPDLQYDLTQDQVGSLDCSVANDSSVPSWAGRLEVMACTSISVQAPSVWSDGTGKAKGALEGISRIQKLPRQVLDNIVEPGYL